MATSQTPKSYSEIVRWCEKNKQKWTDPDFPPAEKSLYRTNNPPQGWPRNPQWKRLPEFIAKPQMFVDGTEPGDIIQVL